jgi:hypothetical protein
VHNRVEAFARSHSFVVWLLGDAFKVIRFGASVGRNNNHFKARLGVISEPRATAGSKVDHRLHKWVPLHTLKLQMLACVAEVDCLDPRTCLLSFQTNPCNVAHTEGLGSRSSQTNLRDDLRALDPSHCREVVHTYLPMLPNCGILIIHNNWLALE